VGVNCKPEYQSTQDSVYDTVKALLGSRGETLLLATEHVLREQLSEEITITARRKLFGLFEKTCVLRSAEE